MDFFTYRNSDHAPDKYLFDWFSQNLPDAQSYFVTDIDFVIRDRAGRLLLLEVKRRKSKVKPHQNVTFQILHQALKQISGKEIRVRINDRRTWLTVFYRGFAFLQFENTSFEDGAAYLNGQQMTEKEIIDFLAFDGNKVTK